MDYFDGYYKGERALFRTHGAHICRCVFDDGESPLKESSHLQIEETTFAWKYPLWYDKDIVVDRCTFLQNARAGIWYTVDSSFSHCHIVAPKAFRKCKNLKISDVEFTDAQETLWWNDGISLNKAKVRNGNYLFMGSKYIKVEELDLEGNYAFDGCQNVIVKNSRLLTKDAFWNCKHVVLENCYIEGEYFGWNSEDVTLIDCEVHSLQGFCYMKGVRLVRCKLIDTTLSFEYCSNIDAEVLTAIDSVKNPISGKIVCKGIGDLIRDDERIDQSKTEIIIL